MLTTFKETKEVNKETDDENIASEPNTSNDLNNNTKYLYSLGFSRESFYFNGKEYWLFNKSDDLQESLDFYFYMRTKTRK